MKRHLIAGRYGPSDKTAIAVSEDEQLTELELWNNKRLDHGIGIALAELNRLEIYPTEVGLDLLILAAHVHVADTRISRVTESQDSWTRELRLLVPVSNPEHWNLARKTLKSMLDFLTGDRWELIFRKRPDSFKSLVKSSAQSCSTYNAVSLFSGGLDSLIGAIDLLEERRHTLFISHAGEGATSEVQKALFKSLTSRYKESLVDRLRVWMAFPDGIVKDVQAESTTRGRSFLFFSLGAFAGSGLRKEFTLGVPENGLIALNVPLDPMRLGANSTRTTHPFYMARWNQLLSELELGGKLVNPYWDRTKGEMMKGCRNQAILQKLAPRSQSCAHPSAARWLGKGSPANQQCGTCLPCLIRRAAFVASWGAEGDSTSYTEADLHQKPLNTNNATGKQVRSFQIAIARLAKNPRLSRILIFKPGSLSDDPAQVGALADVYLRGMEEVASLIRGVSTKPM